MASKTTHKETELTKYKNLREDKPADIVVDDLKDLKEVYEWYKKHALGHCKVEIESEVESGGKYITIDEKEEHPNKEHECGIIWDEMLRELQLKMMEILEEDTKTHEFSVKIKIDSIDSHFYCEFVKIPDTGPGESRFVIIHDDKDRQDKYRPSLKELLQKGVDKIKTGSEKKETKEERQLGEDFIDLGMFLMEMKNIKRQVCCAMLCLLAFAMAYSMACAITQTFGKYVFFLAHIYA